MTNSEPLQQTANMSISNSEKEIQCVVHWFQDWSPIQKGDFLKDLVEKATPSVENLFDAMGHLEMNDKPPSIYKCQMKLFGQWFENWTPGERRDFMLKLQQVDSGFISTFEEMVASAQIQNGI